MQVVLPQNNAQALIVCVVNWIERQFMVVAILALGHSVARAQTENTSALALNPRTFHNTPSRIPPVLSSLPGDAL
jgi:hypothetical protein